MSQTFFVPGTLPGMNDMVRINHFTYSALKKETDKLVWFYIKQAKLKAMYRVAVTIHWCCKCDGRDQDNIMAGQKFILDALVQAKVIMDDRRTFVESITHEWEWDAPLQGVRVTLEEA